MGMDSKSRIYEFSGFRLDAEEHELRRGTEQVAVTPKAIELLTLLIERRGRTVTKEEILEKLWPDTYIDENNLAVTVSMLRKAFGERAFDRKFIETVPKRGYRFVADVTECSDEAVLIEKHTLTEITIEESTGRQPSPYRPLLFAGLVILLGAGMVYFALQPRGTTSDHAAAPIPAKMHTIAVLPLRDLSDSRDDSVSIGLTDALITKLGSIRGLAVRPTGAVLGLSGTPQEIGEKLKVESVLHGTIQRDAKRIRVAVQLINVKDNQIIWTSSFDETFADLFKIQDAFASQIAHNLALNLSDEERARLQRRETSSATAYQLYVKGRYFLSRRNRDSFLKAIEEFERAIAADPVYAQAYAGLADAHLLLGVWGAKPPREVMVKAKQAATKALELDPGLAEPHATLGFATLCFDYDAPAAEAQFQRAIQLNPNYQTAHHWYAYTLAAMGRFDDAVTEIRRAEELSPASVNVATDVAEILYWAGDYEAAIEQTGKALELDRDYYPAHFVRGFALEQKGRHEEALKEFEIAANEDPEDTWTRGILGRSYAAFGYAEKARSIAADLEDLSRRRYVSAYDVALIYAGLGDHDNAIAWLEKAVENRASAIAFMKIEPFLERLRTDQRFTELADKAGLKTGPGA